MEERKKKGERRRVPYPTNHLFLQTSFHIVFTLPFFHPSIFPAFHPCIPSCLSFLPFLSLAPLSLRQSFVSSCLGVFRSYHEAKNVWRLALCLPTFLHEWQSCRCCTEASHTAKLRSSCLRCRGMLVVAVGSSVTGQHLRAIRNASQLLRHGQSTGVSGSLNWATRDHQVYLESPPLSQVCQSLSSGER